MIYSALCLFMVDCKNTIYAWYMFLNDITTQIDFFLSKISTVIKGATLLIGKLFYGGRHVILITVVDMQYCSYYMYYAGPLTYLFYGILNG